MPGDHPRMRGEEQFNPSCSRLGDGSPPHARGREPLVGGDGHRRRITPACAGKSWGSRASAALGADHPRMRGEEPTETCMCRVCGGSPPHARGRVAQVDPVGLTDRITPACAGKRPCRVVWVSAAGDHPRMRGEEYRPSRTSRSSSGSPPHARGRGRRCSGDTDHHRITPACAGKSPWSRSGVQPRPDHPRMRGEEYRPSLPTIRPGGSPPHARGRGHAVRRRRPRWRITPACAGKSRPRTVPDRQPADHPRMRGEEISRGVAPDMIRGSPPHARGRAVTPSPSSTSGRITPACAGKRLPDLHR